MQLYLQDSSNLQTINVQVKQCNMLRYTVYEVSRGPVTGRCMQG